MLPVSKSIILLLEVSFIKLPIGHFYRKTKIFKCLKILKKPILKSAQPNKIIIR
jgi:hypothetical protein